MNVNLNQPDLTP